MKYSDRGKVSRHCIRCGVEFYFPKSEACRTGKRTRRFCSRRCSKIGARNPRWKGDEAKTAGAGRARAKTLYPIAECSRCGAQKAERHHSDGNTLNNSPDNVVILCRRCHMEIDGRLSEWSEIMRAAQPKGMVAAALQRRSKTHCVNGHEYTAENTYISNNYRSCKTCKAAASVKHWLKKKNASRRT